MSLLTSKGGKRNRESQSAQGSQGGLHPIPNVEHRDKPHQANRQPTLGTPGWQHHPLQNANQETQYPHPAPSPHGPIVPNAHGVYQIAPRHTQWHQIQAPQQSFPMHAREDDRAARPGENHHLHQHATARYYDLHLHHRSTPTPAETTDDLPVFPPLAPSDSPSNSVSQFDHPYLSEAECARKYALAKQHLVSGWRSLYPGASVPEEASNIPALHARIAIMGPWAGYEEAVAIAEAHLEDAVQLLQACEPGKVVTISAGVGTGNWRESIRQWAVGVGKQGAWQEGRDGGERWVTR